MTTSRCRYAVRPPFGLLRGSDGAAAPPACGSGFIFPLIEYVLHLVEFEAFGTKWQTWWMLCRCFNPRGDVVSRICSALVWTIACEN